MVYPLHNAGLWLYDKQSNEHALRILLICWNNCGWLAASLYDQTNTVVIEIMLHKELHNQNATDLFL